MSIKNGICISLGPKGACTLGKEEIKCRLARNLRDLELYPHDNDLLMKVRADKKLIERGHADLANWRQTALLCTAILETRRFTTRRVLDGNISPSEIDEMATCDGYRPRLNG